MKSIAMKSIARELRVNGTLYGTKCWWGGNKSRSQRNDDLHYDSPEQILKCLSCSKPDCDYCKSEKAEKNRYYTREYYRKKHPNCKRRV